MKDKVLEFIIEPLNEWFAKPLMPGQAKVYKDVLSYYSPEVLQSAMRELKETWDSKFVPMPANIRALCEKNKPKSTPHNPHTKLDQDFWIAASKVMPTEIGKLALQESWASSLVSVFMNTGKRDWGDEDIANFRRGKERARQAARSLGDHTTEKVLLNLYHAMLGREQKILDKYRYLL